MDYLTGIGDLGPALFLGLIIFGLLFSALGWVLRNHSIDHPAGRKANSSQLNDLELNLRSTQYKLDTREAELREFRQRSTNELRAAKDRIDRLRPLKTSLKDSQNQILRLTEENRQIRRELEDAVSHTQTSGENLSALKRKSHQRREKVAELEHELEHFHAERERETAEINTEFNDLRQANIELLKQIEEKDLQLASSDSNSSEYAEKLETELTQLKTEREHNFAASNAEIDDLRVSNIELLKQLEEKDQQIVRIDSDSAEHANKLENNLAQLKTEHNEKTAASGAEIDDLQQSKMQLINKLHEKEQLISRFNSESAEFARKLAEQVAQTDDLKATHTKLAADHQAATSKLVSANGELDQKNKKLQESSKQTEQLSLLKTQYQDLAQQKTDLEARLKNAEIDSRKATEQQKASAEKHAGVLQQRATDRENSLQETLGTLAEVNQELEQNQHTMAVLQKENSNLKERARTYENKLEQHQRVEADKDKLLSSVKDELTAEVVALKKKLDENRKFEVVNKNQTNTITKLETQLKDLRNKSGDYESLQSQLVLLQSEKAAFEVKFAEINQDKTSLEQRTNELQQKLTQNESQITQLQTAKKAFDGNLSTANKEKVALEKQNKDLLDKLTQSEFETGKLSGLQRQLQQADDKNHELRKRLIELDQLKRTGTEQLETLTAAQKQLQTFETDIAEKSTVIEQLRSLVNEHESELAARANSLSNLEKENLKFKNDSIASEKANAALQDNSEKLQNRVYHLESRSAGLIAEIERTKSTKETLDSTNTELAALKDQNKQASQREQQLLKKNREQSDYIVSIEEQWHQTKSEVTEARKLQAKSAKELAGSSAQLESLNQELELAQSEAQNLNTQIEEQQGDYEQLNTQFNTASAQQDKTNKEKLQVQKKLDVALVEQEKLKSESDALKEQSEISKAEANKSLDQLKAATASVHNLKSTVAKLELERSAVREKNQTTTKEIQSLKQTIESLKANHSETVSSETAELRQALDAANHSSMEVSKREQKANAELQSLETDLSSLKADTEKRLGGFRQQLQQRDTSIESLQAKGKDLELKLETANSQADREKLSLLGQVEKFRAEADETSRSHREQQNIAHTELNRVKQSLAEQSSALQAQKSKAQQLQKALESESAARQSASDQLAKASSRTEALQSQFSELAKKTEQLEKTASTVSELRDELEKRESDYKEHTRQLRSSTQELEQKNITLKKHEEKLSSLSNELNGARSELGKLDKLSAKNIQLLESRLRSFQALEQEQSEELAKSHARVVEQNQQQVTTYENELLALQKAQATLQEKHSVEKSELEAALQKSTERIQGESQKQLDQLQSSLERSNNEASKFATAIKALEKENRALVEQQSAATSQLESVKKQLDDETRKRTSTDAELRQEMQAKDAALNDLRSAAAAGKQALSGLQLQIENDAELISQLKTENSALDDLKTRLAKLSESESKLQQNVRESGEKRQSETQELRKSLVEKERQITQLSREQEKFRVLRGQIAERQVEAEKLQGQINRLAELEQVSLRKDEEIRKLKGDSNKLKTLEKRNSQLEKELQLAQDSHGRLIQSQQEPVADSIDARGNAVELKRLQAQVESLIQERNLGLERVRELSQIAKSVDEKERTIKDLKIGITDTRINDRELAALRNRLMKFESDLKNKNITIEKLRRELAGYDFDSESDSGSASTDASVATRPAKIDQGTRAVQRPRPATQVTKSLQETPPKPLFTAPKEKDDLKKINGIGPVMEETLNSLGITSFQQLAEFKHTDIERVTEALGAFPGRIERDDWVGGAKKEYIEKYKKRS